MKVKLSGEMIIKLKGQCSYISRRQNSTNHNGKIYIQCNSKISKKKFRSKVKIIKE
ncbi:hypothetical protein PZQ55_002490 [Clostridium botulinum]|nr:hypothetical protein [Clostridium botulinum]EKO2043469.1 hypothetical protein [Clostridium botulinum]